MILAGKSVVITGGGSGIGRASAILFAREGARIVCADRKEEWARQTVELIRGTGGAAIAQPCDVTVEADVERAVATAVSAFGRLDVMFNNAGVATTRLGVAFEDYDDDDWDRVMEVNVRGVFYGMKHAVRQFKRQGGGGAIVNTGSVTGMVGWGGVLYGASKGGMLQLTRAAAVEVAAAGIRVNAVCPGMIPFTNLARPDAETSSGAPTPEALDAVSSVHPLGRPIMIEDVAEAALFLACDRAANITGVFLPVDGGYIAGRPVAAGSSHAPGAGLAT